MPIQNFLLRRGRGGHAFLYPALSQRGCGPMGREKITKKELKEKKRQEEKERTKRKREEEQEEYLKNLRGGGEDITKIHRRKNNKIKTISPFCPNRGGSRDIVPRGESDITMCHVSTNTTLHYTTLHYTTLHYTTLH